MTAKQIIEKAKAEVGVVESPANSNNVKYNTWYYGHPVQGSAYPWCCTFISWLFKAEQGLCKKTASCSDLYNWFKAKGQIVTKPQAGDLVFFKWNKNNPKPCEHIGIVVSVSGNVINDIEGNTSLTSNDNGGKVMQRNRYSNIVAYARPKYQESTTKLSGRKSNEEVAKEVIRGLWGSGNDRRQRLTSAGYDYYEIQRIVTQMMKK